MYDNNLNIMIVDKVIKYYGLLTGNFFHLDMTIYWVSSNPCVVSDIHVHEWIQGSESNLIRLYV